MDKSLRVRQICFFSLAFLPVTKFFTMPSVLASCCNNDGLISILINFALDFITAFSIIKLSKRTDKNFFELSKDTLGKTLSKILFITYALFFLFKSFIPISEQKDYVDLTLYINTPSTFNFMPFFLFAFYFCVKRLRVLGRISDVFWAFTLSGLLLLFCLSISNMQPITLLPIGKSGTKNILKGSLYSFEWFGDGLYLLFFIGEFEKTENYQRKILFSFLGVGLITLIFYAIFYSTFSFIAFRQRFALTEISKYSTVINNIGRFDYLAIFALILSTAFSISLPLYFAVRLICHAFNITKFKWIVALIICLIPAISVVIFKGYLYSIESFYKKAGLIFLFFSNILPIILSITLKEKEYASS